MRKFHGKRKASFNLRGCLFYGFTYFIRCVRHLVFELHFFGPIDDADEVRSTFSMLKGKRK